MKILGIESATVTASCAVTNDLTLLGEYSQSDKKTHSEKLMPLIVKLLEDNDIKLKEIDAIAISKGPGSYTGLRIGAAIGKSLAHAQNIPVIAVPTIDALAANVYDTDGYIVPIMDAKGGRAYSGIYKWQDEQLITIKEQFATDMEELIEIINKLDNKVIINGDGSKVYKELLKEKVTQNVIFAPEHLNILKASSVNFIAFYLYNKGITTNAFDFAPEYLRLSQAERMSMKK